MRKYLLRRAGYALGTLLGVSLTIFVVLRVIPGDPLVAILGVEGHAQMKPEDRERIMADLGLSDPLLVQYGNWLVDIGAGRLGKSFFRGDTVAELIARLAQGCALALVSDAGTPLVSDPGYRLVRAARAAGHAVMTIPGASSVLAALTISGLPTDRFYFEGFLPGKGGQRRSRIAELARIPATLVLFESGPRIAASLADLAAGLDNREAAVCRELTKLYEEVRRGELGTLAADYAGTAETRGEFVIVIAPPPQIRSEAANLDALLQSALERLSLKEAVAEIAAVTGMPRRQVYQRALALAKDHDHGR